MSDAARESRSKPAPDAELLEFLGDIDEANDENTDEDFSEFLAHNDIDKLKDAENRPVKPEKVKPEKVKNE